jgi:hypothetical protein
MFRNVAPTRGVAIIRIFPLDLDAASNPYIASRRGGGLASGYFGMMAEGE